MRDYLDRRHTSHHRSFFFFSRPCSPFLLFEHKCDSVQYLYINRASLGPRVLVSISLSPTPDSASPHTTFLLALSLCHPYPCPALPWPFLHLHLLPPPLSPPPLSSSCFPHPSASSLLFYPVTASQRIQTLVRLIHRIVYENINPPSHKTLDCLSID